MASNAGMVPINGSGKTIIMNASITQTNHSAQLNHARMLLGQSIAKGARHNSAERYDAPTCHPNTRVAVIENIMYWIRSPLDSDQPKIKWLNGAAGAGKSSIMQTVAVTCTDEGTMGGSFFFKRSDYQRGVSEHLISTLAYQLCQTIPDIRPHIEAAVDLDPNFLSLSLPTQFTKLILNPLRAVVHQLKRPILIVIDGLDECNDHKVQQYIIRLLLDISRDSSSLSIPFRFLIASRRESQIVSAFSSVLVSASTSPFTEVNLTDNSFDVNDDIRLYMNAKFEVIRRKRDIPSGWPTENDLEHILDLSSGQFIFSSIVISHVDSDDHRPEDRLRQILRHIPYPTDENPFTSLDALYSHIFSEIPQRHLATVKQILPIYLNERISRLWDEACPCHPFTDNVTPQCPCGSRVQHEDVRNVERVLGLAEGDIRVSFCRLSAVVSCEYSDEIGGHQIQVHHASLGDFLNVEDRAGRFFLGDHHTQMQNHIGRVLDATLYPFLIDGTKLRDIHDTRFDHTNCECATDTQRYRTIILRDYLASKPDPKQPPLHHSDIQLFSQIDFAKVFDDGSPINRTYRFRHIDQLKEPESTVLSALNNFVRQQLLSNYCPSLSCDSDAGGILQLFLISKDVPVYLLPSILPSKRSIPGDSLLVEQFLEFGRFGFGYFNLLSSCARVITAHPSWSRIVSDPAYQLKLVHLYLWMAGRIGGILPKLLSTKDTNTRQLIAWVAYHSSYSIKQVLSKLLPKAAFSPEVMLLLRVVSCCNAVLEREVDDRSDMVTPSKVPKTDDGIEDYLSQHKYCDETCRKARHDTLIEQIDRTWKDWNEDLKRHGPRCMQVIIPPLKALFYIVQFFKFTTILRDFIHILAVYHIISNPDMVVYDLARHSIPILNFIVIARVWLGHNANNINIRPTVQGVSDDEDGGEGGGLEGSDEGDREGSSLETQSSDEEDRERTVIHSSVIDYQL